MRPIKFRAWDEENKRMWQVEDLDWSLNGKDNVPIVCCSKDNNGDMPLINLGQLPLMQFTGLKDKNGKEIFEGDILIMYGGSLPKDKCSKCKVIFDDGSFCYQHIDNSHCWAINESSNDKNEIIGNIFQDSHLIVENPKLLEPKP